MIQTATAPVLVLNCGSSSVKCALVDPATGDRRLTAVAERVGTPEVGLAVTRDGTTRAVDLGESGYHGVLVRLLQELAEMDGPRLAAVGHRVVHGGERFAVSVLIDDDVMHELHEVVSLAPLHLPANIAGIEAAGAALTGVPQVAVFDTAFHLSMPPRAYRYAVPTSWYADHGARRYGFHGTSHRYVSARAADLLGRPPDGLRLITAHLGNGCSAAAVRDGRSVDTTMGLTPLEGLVMGTRSGDVDPGLLGYMADRLGLDAAGVVDRLNTGSGLLGLSGLSNDMRTLQDAAGAGSADAQLAIDVFCYRLAKYVAALVVPLGGLDALVFTGGIGEHSAAVRSAVLSQLGFLGLVEDPDANAADGRATGGRITRDEPGARALVVPTDEELLIARDAAALARTTSVRQEHAR
jgi:acetate kinase